MRVGLIACCKTKLDHAAPARDLYCSPLFKACKQWIIGANYLRRDGVNPEDHPELCRVREWGILSAKHGLVMPDQVIEPYDLCLGDMTRAERDAWDRSTHKQIADRWGNDVIYTYVLGEDYKGAMSGFPYCEDMIRAFTTERVNRGMRNRAAVMSIGVLIKRLQEDY